MTTHHDLPAAPEPPERDTAGVGDPHVPSPRRGTDPAGAHPTTTPEPTPTTPDRVEGGRRPRARGWIAAAAVVGLLAGGVGGGAVATVVAGSGSTPSAAAGPSGTTSSTTQPAASTVRGGSVEQVAKQVTPSVVLLKVQGGQGEDEGSGVVLTAGGMILTNNHVVEAAASGGKITVVLNDGTQLPGTIVGRDPVTDLAVVQARGAQGLTPASIGSSTGLQVGQPVVAIGAPLGLQGTVTTGVVSALDRPVATSENGQSSVTDAIQTDAPINPGNSGGPLVDASGQVIGINSSIAGLGSSSPGAQSGSIGLGFSIPITEAMRIAQQIEAGQSVTHAQLGVSVADSTQPAGALLGDITPGSAAAQAGLQSGDVVTRADAQVVDNAESLVAAIRTAAPGARMTLTVVHGGSTRTLTVTLGSDQPTT